MAGFSNPVVRGIAPDPSVVRVGEDFYLASSTMNQWPGILIRHSTDLQNWRIIGAAVTRPAQFRRDGRSGEMMLYAPTLRHHDGRFFVVCTNVADGQGNFIVWTDDPAGEWSDALWLDEEAFDPSLLWDEGQWLYTRRTLAPLPDGRLGPVVQAELDMETGATGPFRELTANYAGFCSNDIEGPHVYLIGEWYYLFSAEGGTWKTHMQTVARSRSPWGPYEPAPHNPILTHRNRVGHPIQSLGHADLVEASDGSWWALALGTRHPDWTSHHNLGRETFLLPVEWVDGWPHLGTGGTTELHVELDRPLPSGAGTRHDAPDTLWTRGWQTVGLPPALDAASVERIALPAGEAFGAAQDGRHVGALLMAQTELVQVFEAVLEETDAVAGIGVYSDALHHYTLTREGGALVFTRTVDDLVIREEVAGPPAGELRLRIEATASAYRFLLALPHEVSVEVGAGSARLLSAEVAENFVGAHFALLSSGPAGAIARFRSVLVDQRTATRNPEIPA